MSENKQGLDTTGERTPENLTARQRQEYLAEGGWRCPFCKSQNIQGNERNYEGTEIEQQVECLDCKRTWKDIYTLKDIEEDES